MGNEHEPKDEKFLGNGAEIYLFLMTLFVIIYSFSAIILLTYTMHKNDQIHLQNIPTILSVIFYFISSVVFLSALTYFNENDDNNFDNDRNFVLCMVLFILFLILAKISVYTQFLTRLYATFKDSMLELRKSTIIISVILLCLLFLTVLWWISLIIVRYLTLDENFDGYDQQFFPVFIFLFIFDVCISWLVVGLFTNKLLKSIMFKSRSDFFAKTGRYLHGYKNSNTNNSTNGATEENGSNQNGHNRSESSPTPDPTQPISINTTSVNFGDEEEDANANNENNENKERDLDQDEYSAKRRQKARTRSSIPRRSSFLIDIAFASIDQSDKQRLDVITRYFMLSALSIMTTQIAYLSGIIGLIIVSVNDMDLNQNAAMAVFGGVFYPFEVVLNCMALYLTFQYASEHYDKLCKCCHERCSRFVVRRASKDILRRHSAEITTIDLHRSIPDEK